MWRKKCRSKNVKSELIRICKIQIHIDQILTKWTRLVGNLRDLIAKKGEKSPPKFLADFLFSTPFKTTYLGVLEII